MMQRDGSGHVPLYLVQEDLTEEQLARANARAALQQLRTRVQAELIATMDMHTDFTQPDQVRQMIADRFDQIVERENIVLPRTVRLKLLEQITDEIVGYGPLEPLLRDDSVTEVIVNGPKSIWVERGGKLFKTDITFDGDEHVLRIIQRILAPLGKHIDEATPMVDARLPDGSRVNAVIPPVSLIGPLLNVRKFPKRRLTGHDLVANGTLTAEALRFLEACVKARLNIVVSGGTGSGKTTLLNVLSSFIPPDERIITIEDVAELQLHQEHVVTLEARKPNIEGKGEITIRDLVINALRMRPDRIVVGEVRGKEALDMLQAMNTGHDGSLTTAHSNSPRDTLSRLETMVLMAGYDLPVRAIREQISRAIDLIVHQERLRDGSRRVVQITEVLGMEGDVIVLQDIFKFEHQGIRDGKVIGVLKPTGIRPAFSDRLERAGITLGPELFGVTPGGAGRPSWR